ncbi:MAG: carbonic anhydrase [Oscillospiraceae bacterium]|jgi:carbonic anhydrase|nr:carbonic anhydrase [Oscillospiraceae bacterium]
MTVTEIIEALKSGNAEYLSAKTNNGDVSEARRRDLAVNGQHPFAVVLTCADSRVVPEHIFSVGLGSLFVIRTAGNVVGDFESGSAEYAAAHLGAQVIVVMGHTHCGAVGAALEGGHAHGHTGLGALVGEITYALAGETEPLAACRKNIDNSVARLLENAELRELVNAGKAAIHKAVYDIETGAVEFY